MSATTISKQKAREARSRSRPSKPATLREPVAWLFGPQLIGSLKGIIVHAMYKKLDIRDWMYVAAPIDMKTECGWTDEDEKRGDAFWFDYLADTGDGQRPTYSIAYLASAELVATNDARVNADVRVLKRGEDADRSKREVALPRGQFLFIGGDTAYHVADQVTLGNRFEGPFYWAHQDLEKDSARGDRTARRPLVGIPGNHDYYDMLDGFNRQFRRPIGERLGTTSEGGLLEIPGLRRVQEASYFAAELPYEWWIYALDTEQDTIDFRQAEFFRSLRKQDKHPAKLIVATPTPTTVFDLRPSPADTISRSLEDLEISLPAAEQNVESEIEPGGCRLDLSGDVHHYARYWGPSTSGKAEAESSPHYASVVAGLGGAFHHPSATSHGDLEAQVKYPAPEDSNREIAKRLFDPRVIIKGGYIGSVGALIAAVFTGAMLARGTTRSVVERIVTSVIDITAPGGQSQGFQALVSLAVFGSFIVLLAGIAGGVMLARHIYRTDPDAGKRKYWIAFGLAFAGIFVFAIALWWARYSPSGQVAFDVILYVLLIGVLTGLIVLAVKQGASGRKGPIRVLFVVLGLVHVVVHVVPVALLIKIGTPIAYGVFLVSLIASLPIGVAILRGSSRWKPAMALAAWLISSAWLISIPLVFHVPDIHEPSGWALLRYLVLAVLIGYYYCCIQFAWYLAVSHVFNGHNNEVGGASRIERFKQFIRFKVEPNQITGYVIAFDDPQSNGADLRPTLRDVFTLRTK
jgi:hypothetical protein